MVAADRACPRASAVRGGGRRPDPALRRRSHPRPHVDRHLQRPQESADGLVAHALRPQRAVRGHLPRAQSASSSPATATAIGWVRYARSAGDQPPALHAALSRSPTAVDEGHGLPGAPIDASCDYKKAPFFNVLAAFWIQFMTHDWFSHLQEGTTRPGSCRRAAPKRKPPAAGPAIASTPAACAEQNAAALHRRWQGSSEPARKDDPRTRSPRGGTPRRSTGTTRPRAAGRSAQPADPGQAPAVADRSAFGAGERQGLSAAAGAADPDDPQWAGPEAVAFPRQLDDRLSFYHTVFAREHNPFVGAFRTQAAGPAGRRQRAARPRAPRAGHPRYRDVTADGRAVRGRARLVVSARSPRFHTTEWISVLAATSRCSWQRTRANWFGLFRGQSSCRLRWRRAIRN